MISFMPLTIDQLKPCATRTVLIDGETVRFYLYADRGVRVRCETVKPPIDQVLSWTELLAMAQNQGVLPL